MLKSYCNNTKRVTEVKTVSGGFNLLTK